MAELKREPEIRLRGISEKTRKELKNIADYHEQDLSSFMRPHIIKIKNSYPDHIRNYDKKEKN